MDVADAHLSQGCRSRAHVLISESINRKLEISSAIALCGWQVASSNVDLNRRQDQVGHCQHCVSGLTLLDKLSLRHAILSVDVVRSLSGHGAHGLTGPSHRWVVVAHVHTCIDRQCQESLRGSVQLMGITPREVTARGTNVGREQRIPHEYRIANQVSHVSGRVTRHMQGRRRQGAKGEGLAVIEQVIELGSISGELRSQVKQRLENLLDAINHAPDCDTSSDLRLEVRRIREVICVGVGLKDPVDGELLRTNESDHVVCRRVRRAPAAWVEIENRVDDGTVPSLVIEHDMGEGAGGLVQKGLNQRWLDVHGDVYPIAFR
jgi:hypothetical protein